MSVHSLALDERPHADVTKGWLVPPDDDDIASQYAKAADHIEVALSELLKAEAALELIDGEADRRSRLDELGDELGSDWTELREHEREFATCEVSVPDPDDVDDWKRRMAERERLPDDYEPTPMPTLDLDTESDPMVLTYSENPKRYVTNRDGAKATNWIARIPRATSSYKVKYNFVNVGKSGEWSGEAEPGDVFAVGSKRNDENREKHFYAVTCLGLQDLGMGDQGRSAAAKFLREQQRNDQDSENSQ